VAGNLSQLFARIILCVVYLPAGVHGLLSMETFEPAEIERLEAMGSPGETLGKVVEKATPASRHAAPEEAESGNRRRSLCRTALRLEDAGVPQPMIMAWAITLLELAGGAALLLGLFTRLFAAPLVLIGAFELWTGVWPLLDSPLPWKWSIGDSQMVAAWLAATLLPVSLVLGGAGKPSIDAMTGGGRKGGKPAASAG
jgi:uncharacterized membrane protein YphA (DoxX/SURF4 family)